MKSQLQEGQGLNPKNKLLLDHAIIMTAPNAREMHRLMAWMINEDSLHKHGVKRRMVDIFPREWESDLARWHRRSHQAYNQERFTECRRQ